MDFPSFYNDLSRLNPAIYDASLPPKAINDIMSNLDDVKLGYINDQLKIPGLMWPSYCPSSAIRNNFNLNELGFYSSICKDDIFLNEFITNNNHGTAITSSATNDQQLTPIFMSESCSADENDSPILPPSSVVPHDELYSPVNDDMLSDTTSTALYENEMSYQKQMSTIATKQAQGMSALLTSFDEKSDSSDTYSPASTYDFYEQEHNALEGVLSTNNNGFVNLSNISFYDEEYDVTGSNISSNNTGNSTNSSSTALDETMNLDMTSDQYHQNDNYLCKRLTELLHKLEHHNSTNTSSDSSLLTVIETEYDAEIKHACSLSKLGNHQHQIQTLQLLNSVMDVYLIALQITGSNGDLKVLSLSRDNSLNNMESSEEQNSYDNSDATYPLGLNSAFSVQAPYEYDEDDNDDEDDEDYGVVNKKSKKRARKNKSNKKQKKLGSALGNKITKKSYRSNNKKNKTKFSEPIVTENEDEDEDTSVKKKSRKNYTSDITSILMDFYLTNSSNPPTMDDKIKLANETNKSVGQISTWFQNARRRQKNKLELFKKYSKEHPKKITDYKSLMKHINEVGKK